MASAQGQWHIAISLPVSAPPQNVWRIVGDFSAIPKWWPGIPTCDIVHGQPQTPGCIRFLLGSGGGFFSHPADGSSKGWAKEQLASVDQRDRIISYAILDNNLSLNNASASMSVADHHESKLALLTWKLQLDPVPALTEAQITEALRHVLGETIKHLEQAALGVGCA